jgi:hypothetical protein
LVRFSPGKADRIVLTFEVDVSTIERSTDKLGRRVTRSTEAYLLLGVFSALLALGLRSSWQVRTGFIPEAPAEFLEIERHLRAFASALVGVSAIGLGFAFATLSDRRWGYRALAVVLLLTAIGTAAVRAIMSPRVVVDPDWPLVLALAIGAAVCWRRGNAGRGDA